MVFLVDDWEMLSQCGPEEFEQKRAEVLQRFIDSAPKENQRRLRGI